VWRRTGVWRRPVEVTRLRWAARPPERV